MGDVKGYIEKNQERYLEELFELLRIPSISADSKYKKDMVKCADFIANHMRHIGLKNVEKIKTGGYPAVYGEWLEAVGKPTVLIYGHYDVQPVDPVNKWETPPFEPIIKDNNIYGRGTADDKGQFFTHIKAVEAYLKNGGLPINVKFFIEGEEEGKDGHASEIVKKYKEKFKCDIALISDSNWFDKEVPSICNSLRGIAYFELCVKGPGRDLHSGSYGGMVRNPLNALAYIISKLQDEKGKVLIPGFYDDVVNVSSVERSEFKNLPFNEESFKKDLGVSALWGEEGYTSLERNWCRPSLDVHGVWGGYSGEGSKTVITTHGYAKISSRLVANQDPEKISKLYKSYIEKICPPGVTAEIRLLHGCRPVLIPMNSPFMCAASAAFEKGFGKRPIFIREGASIPITITFLEELNAPSVLSGLSLPDNNIHSPNEKLYLPNFQKGILMHAYMYEEFGKVKK